MELSQKQSGISHKLLPAKTMITFSQALYVISKCDKFLVEFSFLDKPAKSYSHILKDWTAYNLAHRDHTVGFTSISSLKVNPNSNYSADAFKKLSEQHYAATKSHTEAAKNALKQGSSLESQHHLKAAEHHMVAAKLAQKCISNNGATHQQVYEAQRAKSAHFSNMAFNSENL